MTYAPDIINHNVLSVQACVPADWKDKQITDFVEEECGSTDWNVRKKDSSRFAFNEPARARCSTRQGFVHVVVDFL